MAAFEAIEFCTEKPRDNIRFTESALACHGFNEVAGDDVDFVAVFERGILEVRVNRNSEICRQSPRGCGPDQNKNFSASKSRID